MQAPGLFVCWQLQLAAYSVAFFFFPCQLCCPLRFQNCPQTRLWDGCYSVETSFTTLPPGQVSIPNSFVSVFSFYICLISFWREWVDFTGAWYPSPAFRNCFVEVARHSHDLLVNPWGRKWSPILFLRHLWTAVLFNSSYSVPWMSVCLAGLIALLTLSILLLLFIYVLSVTVRSSF